MLGVGVGRNPGQGLGAHFGLRPFTGLHQRVHQPHLMRLGGAECFAFHQVGLCAHQAQVARHLGHAAGAGQQAKRHFGQAKLDLAVVNGNAVVAYQRHLPASAQRSAAQQADHRLA